MQHGKLSTPLGDQSQPQANTCAHLLLPPSGVPPSSACLHAPATSSLNTANTCGAEGSVAGYAYA